MFKNLVVFRLPCPWDITLEQLLAALNSRPFVAPGNQDCESRGWVAPVKGGESLVHVVGGQWLLALCVEQKLLPAEVIKQVVEAKVDEIASQEGRKVGRKELRELKERTKDDLLPRAFSVRRYINVWIDPANGWLIVNASSAGKADDVVEWLGKSVEALPLRKLHTALSPTAAMAEWLLSGEAPAGFSVDRDCDMTSPLEEKPTVRFVRHSLDGDEVKAHIEAGKLPVKLAMTWQDRMSFVLTENGEIKSVTFLDVVIDEAGHNAETAQEVFDADFALMTGEVSRFLPDLVEAMGGEIATKG